MLAQKMSTMKKLFTIASLVFSLHSFAQDTTTVEQYCQVVATAKLFSTKVNIAVDFGEPTRFFSDKRIKDEEGKLQTFNSVIDAFNYMGKTNWKFVNAYPTAGSSGNIYHYIFRKVILKLEADQTSNN